MSRPRTALVFAGGLGTRMAATDARRPKALVEVCGIPLMEIQIRRLLRAGFNDIRLALRHRAEEIVAAVAGFLDVPRASVSAIVEPEPLGTIGALFSLKDVDGAVLTTNGDLLSAVDFEEMIAAHRAAKADLTIATHDEHHRLKLGEVVADARGRVSDYIEKPVKTYRISSGTYLFEPTVKDRLAARGWTPFPDLVKRAVDAGLVVMEHFHEEPWIDVNDAADLVLATEMLRRDPAAFGVDPERLR